MRTHLDVWLAAGALLMATPGATIHTDPARMLPQEARGWKAVPPDGHYDASSLYELIDGGAEVYRALNVRSVCARRYAKEASPEILADLFDMGSSADAFGAWHHDVRDGQDASVGQESEYAAGMLTFWKGRFFVSILAMEETPQTRAAVMDLGRAIASAIREEGDPPAIARLLPQRDLVRGQLRYFHGQESLSRQLGAGRTGFLGLGPAAEGILARYRPDGAGPGGARMLALIVIRYPAAGDARLALERFSREFLVESGGAAAGRAPDGTWAGARADGDVFAMVLDADARAAIDLILLEVGRRAREGGPPGRGAHER